MASTDFVDNTGSIDASWLNDVDESTYGVANVKHYGALGDGVTDDTVAIQSAINSSNYIFLPPGTYIVSNSGSNKAVLPSSNKYISGSGVGATTVKLKDNENSHIFDMISISNTTIANLSIDGNKSNQTIQVHGIRGQSITNIRIENVNIKDTYHYGIGLQAGAIKQVYINNVFIIDTGADGIDIKNQDDENADIVISNIIVHNPGRIATIQSGLDMNGPAKVINASVKTIGDHDGIRFRRAGGVPFDYGADDSGITNFQVEGDGLSTTSIGIFLPADNCRAQNGKVKSVGFGVYLRGDNTAAQNIDVENCAVNGAIANAGTNCKFDLLTINNCDVGVRLQGLKSRLTNSTIANSTTNALTIAASEISAIVKDNDFSTDGVVDGGTNTKATFNVGYVTENSGTASITSGGTTSGNIAHGLDVTPSASNIHITLTEDPSNTPGAIYVNGIDGTNFVVNCENDPGASNLDFSWQIIII